MNRNVLIGVLVLLVISIGVVVGVFVLQQDQDVREQASVPTGSATITLAPTDATITPGRPTQVSVLFNPASIAISGVSARLSYAYSETTSPVTVSNIAISPGLLTSGDWECNQSEFSQTVGTAAIDISCFNRNPNGFTADIDTLLVTFDLNATSVPEINPVKVTFDPEASILVSVTTGDDVLLTPDAEGTYRVTGGIGGTATPEPSGSATGSATPRPTGTPISRVTPTPVAELPEAGIASPTLIGVGAGVILLMGTLLLAI